MDGFEWDSMQAENFDDGSRCGSCLCGAHPEQPHEGWCECPCNSDEAVDLNMGAPIR